MSSTRAFWILVLFFCLACNSQKHLAEISQAKNLLDENKPNEALALLESLEKTDRKNAEIQYLLGWVYFQKGSNAEALAKFGAAIQYDGQFFGGYNGMAALLMVQGNLAESLSYFNKAAERNPKSPEIFANMAELNMQMGKPDDAEEFLTKAKGLAPQMGDYDFLLAQHHFRRGNLEKANELLKKGADLPFKKAILRAQVPCLRAGIETKMVEAARVTPAFKSQRAQLENLSKTFQTCQNQDAQHFDYLAEKTKVETWLKQKKL